MDNKYYKMAQDFIRDNDLNSLSALVASCAPKAENRNYMWFDCQAGHLYDRYKDFFNIG